MPTLLLKLSLFLLSIAPALVVVLLILPLAGAIGVAVLGFLGRKPEAEPAEDGPSPGPYDNAIRWLSLGSTLAGLVVATVLAVTYAAHPDLHNRSDELTFRPSFVPGAERPGAPTTTWNILALGEWGSAGAPVVQFYLGLDGLNVWLVLLTSLLMVPSVLVSWKSVTHRVPEFFAWMLVLQMAMVGVFLAFDIVLFYVFFELTLVPLFFVIGIWGGPQRQYAAHKFFIYTLSGSLFTMLAVLAIAIVLARDGADKKFTFAIPELVKLADRHGRQLDEALKSARAKVKTAEEEGADKVPETARAELARAEEDHRSWERIQFWVFVALMVGFAIKVPLVPVHTWLPLAHVEAPTAGSVLLAGVLLKIGCYGFLRLCLPLAPSASVTFGVPVLGALAVIGILYGSFCAIAQHDIKKLVAYSSVAHMGYCILGMFALNDIGLSGSLLQMINHGLSTGALFLLVGMLYERYHTRKMSDYGGMAAKLKLLAFFFVFITMSSIGLPGLNGFIGEAMVLLGIYAYQGTQVSGVFLASLASFGVVLSAWYMLTLVMKVFFGELREPSHEGHAVEDLNGREVAALVPIALACLALGVYPQPVLDTIRPDVRVVTTITGRALKPDRGPPAPPRTDDEAHKPEHKPDAPARERPHKPEAQARETAMACPLACASGLCRIDGESPS
jgi:NADH-quinone oxidoreductase subunit M